MLQFVGARFRALVETRWVVEPGIAALAAERADAGGSRRRCAPAWRRCAPRWRDGARFREENRRFHDLLAFASGNPVFRFLLPALHWISVGRRHRVQRRRAHAASCAPCGRSWRRSRRAIGQRPTTSTRAFFAHVARVPRCAPIRRSWRARSRWSDLGFGVRSLLAARSAAACGRLGVGGAGSAVIRPTVAEPSPTRCTAPRLATAAGMEAPHSEFSS